ncbi:hypothetical protein GCM10022223_19780 [Kineosporia mesophila]|uniref:Uncharacterized protein n=2 Tax=Kineosporiaceae TaxID=83778 RepID=A0ABP6ZC86_9ACTN
MLTPNGGRFRFDPALLADLAPHVWPDAVQVRAQGQVADILGSYLHLPGLHQPGSARGVVLGLHRSGEAIGISSGTAQNAADVIAWICAVSRVPQPHEAGHVLLIDWMPDPLPLSPSTTAEELLRFRAMLRSSFFNG